MQPDVAPYGHFLLQAHKETKVPHTAGPQYNDPHHLTRNSIMHNHSRACDYLQIASESSLTTSNYQPFIQVVPWYPIWLLRNNSPVIQVHLISWNLVWVNSLLQWQMNFLHPHLGLENIFLNSSRVRFLSHQFKHSPTNMFCFQVKESVFILSSG